MRAMKGAAEMTSGGIAPSTPIFVPTRILVKGMTHTIKMMKGRERPTLMTHPTQRFSVWCGQMPWSPVSTSSTPRGRPSR